MSPDLRTWSAEPRRHSPRPGYARIDKRLTPAGYGNVPEWQIEPLRASHDRVEFFCGKAPLDEFLRLRATQYETRRLGPPTWLCFLAQQGWPAITHLRL